MKIIKLMKECEEIENKDKNWELFTDCTVG